MTIPLAMDLLLAALLIAMIAHGILLNRRLASLRADREALAAVVHDFQIATGQATAGIDGMRTAADVTGKALQAQIDAGRAAIRDLEFLVERGERMADRLEAASRVRPVASDAAAPAINGRSAVDAASATNAANTGAANTGALLKAIEGMR